MVVDSIRAGIKFEDLAKDHPGREYKQIWNNMSIIEKDTSQLLTKDGYIIVVPRESRRYCLDQLHIPHLGYKNTYQTARDIYFWPNMYSDIKNISDTCKICSTDGRSRQMEPQNMDNVPDLSDLEPMTIVSSDLFSLYGKDSL